jgi:hypothetical protein
MSQAKLVPDRFDRLLRTATFRDGRHALWRCARISQIGAGTLGRLLGPEIVRSGASLRIYDPERLARENLGTQFGTVGARKVDAIVNACEAIEPDRADGFALDVRHVGVGELAESTLLIDATDDPSLAISLTRLSNGLGIPLLRVALDGSGEREFGRVSCSHGGDGHSCQLCGYDERQLLKFTPRTPCPAAQPSRAPTLAGVAISMGVAGLALIQAQRLATGNDAELVFERELLLDLSDPTLVSLVRRRSSQCLSGHVRWELTRIDRVASGTTLADVFAESTARLGQDEITLEPYGHPLALEAHCGVCGATRPCVGTRWATPPACRACAQPMTWAIERQRDRLTLGEVHELGIHHLPLDQLGLPERGAMLVARTPGKPPLRLVLK